MPATYPRQARSYRAASAALAARAVREAHKVEARGALAVATVVATHQASGAIMAQSGTAASLASQGVEASADALLNALAFTTPAEAVTRMLDQIDADFAFDRLVASLVQDAQRAAQGVSLAVRPHVGYVRVLNLPSCSRCAVLAGRVYRYTFEFLRHPGCDCTMMPVAEGDDKYAIDPTELMREGQITGLAKADREAIEAGADFQEVVNIRQRGVTRASNAIYRDGRLTPEAIYRQAAGDRERALALLQANGYIR